MIQEEEETAAVLDTHKTGRIYSIDGLFLYPQAWKVQLPELHPKLFEATCFCNLSADTHAPTTIELPLWLAAHPHLKGSIYGHGQKALVPSSIEHER